MTEDILFIIGLLLSICIEGAGSFFPITLSVLVVLSLIRKGEIIFLYAFVSGLLLDILLLRSLGVTSFVFCLLIGLLFLYERKYEIQTLPFVLAASFFMTFFYLLFFRAPYIFIQSFLSAIVSCMLFLFTRRFIKPKETRTHYSL